MLFHCIIKQDLVISFNIKNYYVLKAYANRPYVTGLQANTTFHKETCEKYTIWTENMLYHHVSKARTKQRSHENQSNVQGNLKVSFSTMRTSASSVAYGELGVNDNVEETCTHDDWWEHTSEVHPRVYKLEYEIINLDKFMTIIWFRLEVEYFPSGKWRNWPQLWRSFA